MKSKKLRVHPNDTRNEAMICLSNEEEAQLAITEIKHIQTMEGRTVQTNQEIKRIWERHRNHIIATRNMNKEKTAKVQLNK